MTKHRPPLSIDAALARIAGQLQGGWNEMAFATRRSESTVRNWGNPDREEQVPIECAIALDLKYQEAGGIGAPIYEAYTVLLDLAGADRFAGQHQRGQLAAGLIRECSDAEAALVIASQPGATPGDIRDLLREADEAVAKLHTVRLLAQNLLDGQLLDPHPSTGPPGAN